MQKILFIALLVVIPLLATAKKDKKEDKKDKKEDKKESWPVSDVNKFIEKHTDGYMKLGNDSNLEFNTDLFHKYYHCKKTLGFIPLFTPKRALGKVVIKIYKPDKDGRIPMRPKEDKKFCEVAGKKSWQDAERERYGKIFRKLECPYYVPYVFGIHVRSYITIMCTPRH